MIKARTLGMVVGVGLLLGLMAVVNAQTPIAEEVSGLELTVYNQNLALVRDRRAIELQEGVNEVTFQDVAAQIDPSSVLVRSLTDVTGTVVLEQNYEYDIVSSQRLLERFVDHAIEIITEDGSAYRGTLLSGQQDVILGSADGMITMVRADQVREFTFPELPEGLITRPTLLWLLEAETEGDHDIEVTYLTEGVNWQADYVVLLDSQDQHVDVDAWITLNNTSGASYDRAKLKLVAGDIHRTAQPDAYYAEDYGMAWVAAAPSVQERAFFEYHLYEIQRPVTVKDRQTKQIEFASASSVPASKYFVLDASQQPYYGSSPITEQGYGATDTQSVMVVLEFVNGAEEGLGIPLPKGRVRVYKEDVDGSAQLVGEDSIDHTPRDETVRLYVGDAFDIVAERKQTNFRKLGDRSVEETFEITIRNHKEEDVEVRVVEHLYRWSEWEITEETEEHTKVDARTVEYLLNVSEDDEATLTYTVLYRW